LTAEAGRSSAALSDVLSNPTGVLAATLALPFLNVQRVRLTRGIARSQYEEDVATFRQTMQQALAEVDDTLSALTHLREQEQRLAGALQHASEAERFYEVRYRAGVVPLRDWLIAQETRRTAEVAWLENRFNQLSTHVRLNQVLGGSAATE
jgi:outer membrane protein TolC